jgi:hypothetical protein
MSLGHFASVSYFRIARAKAVLGGFRLAALFRLDLCHEPRFPERKRTFSPLQLERVFWSFNSISALGALCDFPNDPLKPAIACLFVKSVQSSGDRLLADSLIRIDATIYLLRQRLQRHDRIPYIVINQFANHRHDQRLKARPSNSPLAND